MGEMRGSKLISAVPHTTITQNEKRMEPLQLAVRQPSADEMSQSGWGGAASPRSVAVAAAVQLPVVSHSVSARERVLASLGMPIQNKALTERDFARASKRWQETGLSVHRTRDRARTADMAFSPRWFRRSVSRRVEILIHVTPRPRMLDRAQAASELRQRTDAGLFGKAGLVPLPPSGRPGARALPGTPGTPGARGRRSLRPLPPLPGETPNRANDRLRLKLSKAAHRANMVMEIGGVDRVDSGRVGEQLGKKLEMRRLKEVWASVDADGSGLLHRGEVRQLFKSMGKSVNDRDFERAMNQARGNLHLAGQRPHFPVHVRVECTDHWIWDCAGVYRSTKMVRTRSTSTSLRRGGRRRWRRTASSNRAPSCSRICARPESCRASCPSFVCGDV